MVVGPAVGGIVIAAAGIGWAYTLDVITFAAMVAAVALMSRQHPLSEAPTERFLPAVRAGLAFARSRGELMGGFAVDLLAMTFGMPRALFPALSLTVYHSGATGVGLLYAALSAGATVAAFSTGWLTHVRRLGRVVVIAIALWGIAITLAGLTHSLAVALACLLIAGSADSISAVCRSTILITVTPEEMRGRLSAIYILVVAGGPRVGDVESGTVAAALGARTAVTSGGLLCLVGPGADRRRLPRLLALRRRRPCRRRVRSHRVTDFLDIAGGVRLAYDDFGSGRPVVLVHGVSMSRRFFERNLDALAERFRVVNIDLRGHGESPPHEGGHTVAQYGRDLHEAMRQLGLESAGGRGLVDGNDGGLGHDPAVRHRRPRGARGGVAGTIRPEARGMAAGRVCNGRVRSASWRPRRTTSRG